MESDLIAYLRRRLPRDSRLELGIGDDAAVFGLAAAGRCVVTVDMLMDGVDFRLEEVDPRRIGRKALAINLSDLAAMAAEPLAVVVALALPRQGGLELAKSLYEGMIPLAEEFGVAIAGGDTNSWDAPLAISVTAMGLAGPRGVLRRDGARPGDRILVTGALGGSILGHHFDFTPRVREALQLQQDYELHAGMDISDGLLLDLSRLVAESGCAAELNLQSVPVAGDAEVLSRQPGDGRTPLDHALADGEDFELLLAVPAEEAARLLAMQPLPVALCDIGAIVAGDGLWAAEADGSRRRLEPRGYQHHLG